LVVSNCQILPVNRQMTATAKSPAADERLKFCEVFGVENGQRHSTSDRLPLSNVDRLSL
jgi:hypothetical protein